jgi:hypothetical protein
MHGAARRGDIQGEAPSKNSKRCSGVFYCLSSFFHIQRYTRLFFASPHFVFYACAGPQVNGDASKRKTRPPVLRRQAGMWSSKTANKKDGSILFAAVERRCKKEKRERN